jgi:hypothetical protein
MENQNMVTETKGKLAFFWESKSLFVDEAGNVFMLSNDPEGLVYMKQLTSNNKGVK